MFMGGRTTNENLHPQTPAHVRARSLLLCLIPLVLASCGTPKIERVRLPVSQEDLGPSINAFRISLHPVLKENCFTCHSTEGTGQTPLHAENDATVAHDEILLANKVDLSQPIFSRIYTKVKEGHSCWGDCASNSAEILAGIEDWVEKLGELADDTTVITQTASVLVPAALPAYGQTATTLTFPLDGILGLTGATVSLRITNWDDDYYHITHLTITATQPVYVKAVHIPLNSVNYPWNATYRFIDTTVASGATAPNLSSAAMLMQKDKGAGVDQISVGFETIKVGGP